MEVTKIPQSIDEYIALYTDETKNRLELLRETIHTAVPEATEKISWGMPTFYFKGNLIHFAAAKYHIGIYQGVEAIVAFAEDLKSYKTSKGAVQFPFNAPLPLDLVIRIVKFNLEERL